MQRQLLIQQVGEQRAKLAALDRQKAQKEAELATVKATAAKLEALIPVLNERVEMIGELLEPIRGTRVAKYTGLTADFVKGVKATAIPASVTRAGFYMSNWDLQLESARKGKVQSFFPATSSASHGRDGRTRERGG